MQFFNCISIVQNQLAVRKRISTLRLPASRIIGTTGIKYLPENSTKLIYPGLGIQSEL